MSASVNYLTTKAVCRKCTTHVLNECVVRPRGDFKGLRFNAISTGWLMCKCGFRFDPNLHSVRLKGND